MTTEQRIDTLEREVAELRAKVASIEEDLALVPGLITTGFRQTSSQIAPSARMSTSALTRRCGRLLS